MKPSVNTPFNLTKILQLPLALLAVTVLVSGCGGKRKETPEYPYGYTTRVLVDETTGIQNYGSNWKPAISADGRYVAFNGTVQNKVEGVAYVYNSVFVYDRKIGETVCASVGKDGQPGEGGEPAISADGRYVAFVSSGLDRAGGLPHAANIYVRDMKAAQTTLVSIAYNEQPANGSSFDPSISADGRYVAFESSASNLVKEDTGRTGDVFVYDRKTGKMRRASVASDGMEANGPSSRAMISASGRYVAFYSQADNLSAAGRLDMPGYHAPDEDFQESGAFLHDLDSGKTVSISANQGIPVLQATRLDISADGRYVVFLGGHLPSNLEDLKDYGLYIYERRSGKTEFLLQGIDGEPPESMTYDPSLSDDGRYVAFESYAGNLVAEDSGGYSSIFVLDRKENTIRLMSVSSQNVQGDMNSYDAAISGDGQHVVFVSEARNLVEGYPKGAIGVFIHDISNWGDYPLIDARRFSQATPFPGLYPPPTNIPPHYPYPYPAPPP